MRRSLLLAIALVAVACPTAQASTLSINHPTGKYPWLNYDAAPGETNNVFLRVTTTGVGSWPLGLFNYSENEVVMTDLGAVISSTATPVLNGNGCIAAVVAATCVIDGLERLNVSLADGNDKVDVHHPEVLGFATVVTCGPGDDSVRALGSYIFISSDCEHVTRT